MAVDQDTDTKFIPSMDRVPISSSTTPEVLGDIASWGKG